MLQVETQRERDLQYEVDRLREEQERERERNEREAKERRRARQNEWESECRTATTWPEALAKQKALFSIEARQEGDDDLDKYFSIGVQAVDKAIELWGRLRAVRSDEISELEQRINQIEDEIRIDVAKRLRAESDKAAYHHIAQSIEENELDRFLDW